MDNKELEDKIVTGVTAILGMGGIAAQNEASFVSSKDQIAYATNVAKGFCSFDEETGKTSLNAQQGATGTGKTVGYLVGAMLYATYTGERVMVSTFTKQLQKQLVEKDVPNVAKWVAQYTGLPEITYTTRVGMSNYVSAKACKQHMERLQKANPDKFEDAIIFLELIQAWLGSTGAYSTEVASGRLQDFMYENNYETLPFGVKVANISLRYTSPKEERAKYKADVVESKTVDLLIVNHALLATHAYRWTTVLDDKDDRTTSALVCDEADRLPAAVDMIISHDVSLHMLLKHTQDAGLGGVEAVKTLYDQVQNLEVPANNLRVIAHGSQFEDQFTACLDVLKPIRGEAIALVQSGTLDEEAVGIYTEFIDSVNDLNEAYKAITEKHNSAVVSWSPVYEYPSILVTQPDAGRILSRMWSVKRDKKTIIENGVEKIISVPAKKTVNEDGTILLPSAYLKAALFTSATISLPNQELAKSFDPFFRSIGVINSLKKIYKLDAHGNPEKDKEGQKTVLGTSEELVHDVKTSLLARFEPRFGFGSMSFVFCDPNVPKPTLIETDEDGLETVKSDPVWLDYVATGIRSAAKIGGRVLVLSLSWRDTQEVAYRLKDVPNLLVQTKDVSVNAMKKVYLAKPNAIWITPAGWEGLDLPGNVQHLILTRVPMAPKDAARDELTRSHMKAQKISADKIESTLWAKRMLEMQRKATQGVGRGVRNKNDVCKVWFLDPRFPYPNSMKKSLDPLMLLSKKQKQYDSLVSSIPVRFRDVAYENGQICLMDGTLYSLSSMVVKKLLAA